VNCFQIVSLTLEPQLIWKICRIYSCCELLSDCIFDIGTTTSPPLEAWTIQLWIAFRLYLWHWNHNKGTLFSWFWIVVNCFQIVSLTLEPQQSGASFFISDSCELLSDCIFDIGTTTTIWTTPNALLLWIAFRLYLWHWNHNILFVVPECLLVVNCFQIVSLTLEPQQFAYGNSEGRSCELLSDCIFDIGTTTLLPFCCVFDELWIAFRLYLWHWNHNMKPGFISLRIVVNCFQIVSLTLEPQQLRRQGSSLIGCELLSDCIFDIGTTTVCFGRTGSLQLWIAFRLYLWHWNHNQNSGRQRRILVVNCFQIVSLTLEPQQEHFYSDEEIGCELLSDCIFDIGTTTV